MDAQTLPTVAPPQLRSWFYIFRRGYLYASSTLASTSTKQCASLLLSCNGQPFEVECDGRVYTGTALVVRPDVERHVRAHGVPLLSCGVSPAHPLYRAFTRGPGSLSPVHVLQPAPRARRPEEPALALEGRLPALSAARLTEELMQQAADALGAPPPLDARIARVIELLDQDPSLTPEQLAAEIRLSYHRLSHLFSNEMGVSLRTCLIALRVDRAGALASHGISLTDVAFAAGFADSAHFSKTWSRACGASPSRFFNDHQVGLVSAFLPR